MILTERSVEIPFVFARLEGHVLDIGSSDAEYLNDLPEGSYLLDQRPLTAPQPPNTTFVLSDVRSIPLEDESFDTVVCLSTYEHLGKKHDPYNTLDEPDERVPERGMAEMWRVLRVGGKLLMTLPFGLSGDYGWVRQWNLETLIQEFEDYWKYVTEIEFYRLQLSPTKEYVLCEPGDCTEHYDFTRCRANAVVCLVFQKESL